MVLRARFDGRVFIPDGPVGLQADRIVELDVRELNSLPHGSPRALLEAIAQPPHLEPGDAIALEEAINSAQLPIQFGGIFDEPQSGSSER
jgi:hypothetical protein